MVDRRMARALRRVVAAGPIWAVALSALCDGVALGQATDPVAELSNPVSMGNQRFGSAFWFGLVANEGGSGSPQQVLAAGSPWADVTLPGGTGAVAKAGCVTLFVERQFGWVPMRANLGFNLVAPGPAANGNFGQSISMSGSFMVVGAPGMGPPLNSGRAYVYEWAGTQPCAPGDTSEWCLRGELANSGAPGFPDSPTAVDLFGSSVANLGSIIAVGAPGNDVRYPSVQFPGQTVNVTDCGSVTLFSPVIDQDTGLTVWRPFAFVRPPVLNSAGQADPTIDPSTLASSFFGSSIAMNGSTLVVGSKRTTVTQSAQGAVYVYDFDPIALTVTYRQRLHAPTTVAQANEQMGTSVSSEGGRIVAGAPNRSGGAGLSNQGAAYVFERDPPGTGPFVYVRQFRASDPQAGDLFGSSVATRANRIIIGAPGKDFGGDTDRGSAYVFAQEDAECNEWLQVLRISPNLGSGAQFGSHVGLSFGETFAGGAPGATSPAGPGQGLVLLYERELVGCPYDLNGDGATNGLDVALSLAAWGVASGTGYYADFNADGVVDGFDLTAVLANWGPCSCAPAP